VTLRRKYYLRMPLFFSSRDSIVAPRIAFPLSIWRIKGLMLALAAARTAGAVVTPHETGTLHQLGCDLRRLNLGHTPDHLILAPDIDHQVEVKPQTPYHGGRKLMSQHHTWFGPSTIRPEAQHQSRFKYGINNQQEAGVAISMTKTSNPE
jgi:hypothetical protein